MKKLIALLLVLVTLFTMTSAAFTDEKKIGQSYLEAVNAMTEKGVVNGFEDGSFQPAGTLTRAQAAKMICVLLFGKENVDTIVQFSKDSGFTDVPASHWSSGFVSYCASVGVVAGVGNGKFDPNGKLTGLAFGKMLLTAYGHKAEAEGLTGAGWDTNTLNLLKKEGRTVGVEISSKEMSRQEACQLAYNFTFPAVDVTNYAESTVSLKDETNLYKTYGRTFVGDNGVSLDFAGQAIELTAEFMGDVYLTYNSQITCYFRCYVDGKEVSRVETNAGTNGKVRIARNIHGGEHTLRVVRDTDAAKQGQLMELTSIIFTGVKSSVKAPADKSLLIEFLGDSITAGKYTEMQYESGEAIHAGTNSYAYLTAQAMDADWSMLARGGCGFFHVKSCPKTMRELYPYYNGFMTSPVAYTPARQADVVVLALGTNDAQTDPADTYDENGTLLYSTFEGSVKYVISQIRAMHGSDVKIVLLHGMMSSTWISEFKKVAESENVYRLQVSTNRDGGSNHPSIEGHKKNAEQLTKFLKETVLK